ncbi:hypothetical protein O181_059210 [Austropuccinia psidii MF-1]|uniref:Reverse transcriptase domain-containing protein n=1 Tax=Austropuccinia psidii MF-1 TaxID=1389203 RepID=A0A9Q3EB24_9BASI|nr:hypothetical protein [Austropuccinia psidii MF-1]
MSTPLNQNGAQEFQIKKYYGDVENSDDESTIFSESSKDIENINSTRIGSSRVNLKARFNTPSKDSVVKNPKENSNNVKYKSADTIRKCHICQSTTHLPNTCPKKGKINEIDIEKESDVEKNDNIEENSDDKSSIFSESSKDIENKNSTVDIMESYSHLPQLSNGQVYLSKPQDAQLMKTKPKREMDYTAGSSCITEVVIDSKPIKNLLDQAAFCSCVSKYFLKTCVPNFEDQLLPIYGININSASSPMKALGIFETTIIFPYINGNLRVTVDCFVMEHCSGTHFMLGNDYLIMYFIDRQITLIKVSPVNLELGKLKSEQLNESELSLHLTDKQEGKLSSLLYNHKEAFASDKETLGEIIGLEVDIILNIERSHPLLLRRPAYPESPKSREALEIHIKELLDLGVIRKVGHNEEVEITTPVIVEWHNGKSRMVGDFGDLNTYTVPDRYPIPKIQIFLTQISQAVYISTMDALKGFHKNLVKQRAQK